MADPARTETATPRRREEARRRGQVARSGELTAALLLLAVLLFFRYAGGDLLDRVGGEARLWWGGMGSVGELSEERVAAGGLALLGRALAILAPLLVLVALVAVAANIGQIGLLFTPQALAPRPDNLNPLQGFQRMFSRRTFVDLAKAAVKIALVGWVAYAAFTGSLAEMSRESVQSVPAAFATAAALSWRLGIRIVLVLLAIAILDYVWQRIEYERSLRMTRQEVRDEFRQMEGDPLVKARIRQLQRAAARRRMISEVPKADVVITNPVHLAVAVRYDPGGPRAPQIVAKGARLVAERMKELAREHRVPLYEDPPLAQALFQVPVGAELPPALYQAVAKVLAFVYHAGSREKERQVLGGVPGRPVPVREGALRGG